GMIASGPTVVDVEGDCQAEEVLARYQIEVNDRIREALERRRGQVGADFEPGRLRNLIIGNNRIALDVARAEAERIGFQVITVGSELCGEASHVVASLVDLVRQHKPTDEEL